MKNLVLLILLAFTIVSFGQDTNSTPVVKVKGTAEVKVTPDVGILLLQVKHIDTDFSQIIARLNNKTNDIIKELKKLGYKESEIKTTNFNITENRQYRRDSWIDSGFVATQNLEVEFKGDKENIAKILNAFNKSPRDFSMSFNFKLSDTLKTSTRENVINLAVQDAKNKSNVISTSAGIRLKKIHEISYGLTQFEVMREMDKMRTMATEADQSITGFTPQDFIISDEVIITWEIE